MWFEGVGANMAKKDQQPKSIHVLLFAAHNVRRTVFGVIVSHSPGQLHRLSWSNSDVGTPFGISA
jgi:hypothetical protein